MRRVGFIMLGFAIVLAGCASGPAPVRAPDDVYLGAGRGATLGSAINAAKMDAVRKAVIDLIGAQAEAAQADVLDEVLYSTRNPNAFVLNDTMETIRRDGSLAEGDLYYEISIRVNVPAVRNTLEANGITSNPAAGARPSTDGTATTPGSAGPEGSPPGDTTTTGAATLGPVNARTVTPQERQFISRYVDTMTYMVYFAEDSAEEFPNGEFVMRSAVNQANGYLVREGHFVVDADQVDQLREDQRLVWEEQQGEGLSLLQWVARRLNADVYVEIDARITSRSDNVNHYAIAVVTLNMYETSTGQILGSLNRRSQEAFSRASQEDAAMNALQSIVFQSMPQVVDMSRTQMERQLTRGIRYEVTFQRPPDARTLSRFRTAMLESVREIATVNQSPEEVLYEIYLVGSTDDLVDLIFTVSDRLAGFEDMSLVISRGRSLTFDVGL